MSDFFETISEIKKLKKENEELRTKNQRLLSENLKLLELKQENEALRQALENDLEKEFDLVIASVLGKDFSQDSILIDKGSEDGISKNLPVITSQKTLLGKVDQVFKNFSRVSLISNKQISFSAKIIDSEFLDKADSKDIELKEKTQGVVRGEGGFEVIFDLIPQGVEVKEGDLILTTGLEGVFPKGLLAGSVKKIKKEDIAPFQKAELDPAFNIKELNTVFVVTSF